MKQDFLDRAEAHYATMEAGVKLAKAGMLQLRAMRSEAIEAGAVIEDVDAIASVLENVGVRIQKLAMAEKACHQEFKQRYFDKGIVTPFTGT